MARQPRPATGTFPALQFHPTESRVIERRGNAGWSSYLHLRRHTLMVPIPRVGVPQIVGIACGVCRPSSSRAPSAESSVISDSRPTGSSLLLPEPRPSSTAGLVDRVAQRASQGAGATADRGSGPPNPIRRATRRRPPLFAGPSAPELRRTPHLSTFVLRKDRV